jgi:hypothetical protein
MNGIPDWNQSKRKQLQAALGQGKGSGEAPWRPNITRINNKSNPGRFLK